MNFNDLLKSTEKMTGPFPKPDQTMTDHPFDKLHEWYLYAYEDKVKEPHSMVLSTTEKNNAADSRVVLLKAADDSHLYFETAKSREKVTQLADNSSVALNFYWREHGRQIRIRGTASPAEDISHISDYLDASVRDLNAYKVSPSSFEFYQTLAAGGNSRFSYQLIDGKWQYKQYD